MRTTTIKIALPERRDITRAANAARCGVARFASKLAQVIEPKPVAPTLDELKQPAGRRMSVGEHLHLQESLSTLRAISSDFDEPAEMIGRPRTENVE